MMVNFHFSKSFAAGNTGDWFGSLLELGWYSLIMGACWVLINLAIGIKLEDDDKQPKKDEADGKGCVTMGGPAVLMGANAIILALVKTWLTQDRDVLINVAWWLVIVESVLCSIFYFGAPFVKAATDIDEYKSSQRHEQEMRDNEERQRQEAAQQRAIAIRTEQEIQQSKLENEAQEQSRKNRIEFEKFRSKTLQSLAVLGKDLDKTDYNLVHIIKRFEEWKLQLDLDPIRNYPSIIKSYALMLDDMMIMASRRQIERGYEECRPIIEHRLHPDQLAAMLDSAVHTFQLGQHRKQVQEEFDEVRHLIGRLIREESPEYEARIDSDRAEYYFQIFDNLSPQNMHQE
ncbi:MAG TPA: hypothetical protein VFE46_13385 [Pirellulales bacterium]|jgi:hypothetical protein|nr:hypothetical protein [Pirellulales bacterium]